MLMVVQVQARLRGGAEPSRMTKRVSLSSMTSTNGRWLVMIRLGVTRRSKLHARFRWSRSRVGDDSAQIPLSRGSAVSLHGREG